MKPGEVYLVKDFAGGHLYFPIAELPDGRLIFCHFTECKSFRDQTCVVQPGEHEAITKKSVVEFASAFVLEEMGFKHFEDGCFCKHKPLKADLLIRIRQSALLSPQTSDVIKAALKDCLPYAA